MPPLEDPPIRLFVPGRIEVFGKHTDYAGGRSLLAAVDRGFHVRATAIEEPFIRLTDLKVDQTLVLDIPPGGPRPRPGSRPRPRPLPRPRWSIYPETVVARASRDFPGTLTGAAIELESDLPPAAGLSSSTAFVTATFLALDAVCGFSDTDAYRAAIPDREALAGYLAAVESGRPFPGLGAGRAGEGAGSAAEGVGLRGGGEDHVAVLCAVEGALVQYAFEPVRRERVIALPEGWTFAVASSGVVAEKTGAARDDYNRLSDRATLAARLWCRATGRDDPHITAALAAADGTREVCDAIRKQASAEGVGDGEVAALVRRVEHVHAENRLVSEAAGALEAGDVSGFGEAAATSHRLAEDWLGNQVPQTSALVRQARDLGAVAASAFGAGFGGAVWAMTREDEASAFLERWAGTYLEAFPARREAAEFFTTPPSGPARVET